jgi:hypothetical protein
MCTPKYAAQCATVRVGDVQGTNVKLLDGRLKAVARSCVLPDVGPTVGGQAPAVPASPAAKWVLKIHI